MAKQLLQEELQESQVPERARPKSRAGLPVAEADDKIYMEEEHRLQAYFRDTHAAQDAYEYSTQVESTDDRKPSKAKRRGTLSALKRIVKPKKREEQKSISDIAVVRVEEERLQIYEALKKHTSGPARQTFYEQFKIAPSSKKKKRRLANLVWNLYDDAGVSAEIVVSISASSDRYHPLPAQIDRHKQLRLRDDLAFTVNAALKSIRYAARPDSSLLQPRERELIELQHQVRMLANQNQRLMGDLALLQRETSRLQMELQIQQQPQQLRKVNSDKSIEGAALKCDKVQLQ
uniref:Uncharacterized protein n=1 Tax=Globisporangium ultimum (strain ATCC 200006 / CBS 805.95 / DAOM BR144) TaxID=431595 RepID=K3W6V1_GLOUD